MTAYRDRDAAAGWATGPDRVLYGRLAEVLVAACPTLTGRTVLDLGAGTGAASRAAVAAGARVFAVDRAPEMLTHDAAARPPAAAAAALALPLADASVDGVLAAFLLNHLPDPAAALAEARRVTRTGGFLAASTFHAGWDHPVKHVVDGVAASFGYTPPGWYRELKSGHAPQAGDPDNLAAAARAAGLDDVQVRIRTVDAGAAGARDLVRWRLGMAQLSPFVACLAPADPDRLTALAVERLGPNPERLRPEVLLLSAIVPRPEPPACPPRLRAPRAPAVASRPAGRA